MHNCGVRVPRERINCALGARKFQGHEIVILHNHNAQDFPHFSSKITKKNCLEKYPCVKKKEGFTSKRHTSFMII